MLHPTIYDLYTHIMVIGFFPKFHRSTVPSTTTQARGRETKSSRASRRGGQTCPAFTPKICQRHYPPVNVYITMANYGKPVANYGKQPHNITQLWKITSFNGKNPLFQWPFSIDMLNCQSIETWKLRKNKISNSFCQNQTPLASRPKSRQATPTPIYLPSHTSIRDE